MSPGWYVFKSCDEDVAVALDEIEFAGRNVHGGLYIATKSGTHWKMDERDFDAVLLEITLKWSESIRPNPGRDGSFRMSGRVKS